MQAATECTSPSSTSNTLPPLMCMSHCVWPELLFVTGSEPTSIVGIRCVRILETLGPPSRSSADTQPRRGRYTSSRNAREQCVQSCGKTEGNARLTACRCVVVDELVGPPPLPTRAGAAQRHSDPPSWGAAGKDGQGAARRTVHRVRTSAERAGGCRQRHQVVRRAAPPPGRTTARGGRMELSGALSNPRLQVELPRF